MLLAVVGVPAVVLRGFCIGRSCDAGEARAESTAPFCSLPEALRARIAAGFREGRSPDVMAATSGLDAVSTDVQERVPVPWPGVSGTSRDSAVTDDRVPIVFFGEGISRGTVPDGVALDSIAPTLEAVTGFRRQHPDVRTGEAIDGVGSSGAVAPLLVVIAWKGIGTPDLGSAPDAWPFLRDALREGAGTIQGVAGSLPPDPAATLTTIGTGAIPASHGITGTLIREDDGDVSQAWSTTDAGSVIAGLADDLDRDAGERARIAAVLADPTDLGIIGDGWYLDAQDDDAVAQAGRDPRRGAALAANMVSSEDLGADAITDLLGVVLQGRVRQVDAATADLVSRIRALVPSATFVLAGTGSLRGDGGVDASELAAGVGGTLQADVVREVSADGLFLDRDVLVERSITSAQVAEALRRERSAIDEPLFHDVYPAFAVAFSRYC